MRQLVPCTKYASIFVSIYQRLYFCSVEKIFCRYISLSHPPSRLCTTCSAGDIHAHDGSVRNQKSKLRLAHTWIFIGKSMCSSLQIEFCVLDSTSPNAYNQWWWWFVSLSSARGNTKLAWFFQIHLNSRLVWCVMDAAQIAWDFKAMSDSTSISGGLLSHRFGCFLDFLSWGGSASSCLLRPLSFNSSLNARKESRFSWWTLASPF